MLTCWDCWSSFLNNTEKSESNRHNWRGPAILKPLYGPGHLVSKLAPYFLPTTSYLLIGASFLFTTKKVKWFLLVLGFLTAFHVLSTWAETHYHQPDIQNVGLVFSSIFLPVANVMALGGVVAYAKNGPTGFVSFWVNGAWRSLSLGHQLFVHDTEAEVAREWPTPLRAL